jgi:N-acyl-phosphatidylethanolamine-hydrolysing phospholipase D
MDRPAHHGTNGRFRNPAPLDRGGVVGALPFLVRRLGGFFRDRPGKPPSVANDGAFLRENARHSEPTVTWIGHATVLVQMDHRTFLTDPIWSDKPFPVSFVGPMRFVPPALTLESLPPIDFVLVSHNHYDHLDLPTLRWLSARGTRFLVPLGDAALLRDNGIGPVEEMDWWDAREVAGLEIHCVPAQHWSGRRVTDDSRSLWAGWTVTGPTRRFYFAGDSGYFPGFAEIGARLGPFGLAALPIGAYDPPSMMRAVHLDPEEALQAGLDVGAERMLGIHYGTFDLTDEPLDEAPRRFHADAVRRGIAAHRVWTPPLGETLRW